MQVLAASDADADEERVASDSISRSSSSVSAFYDERMELWAASELRYIQARRVTREKYDRSGENYTIAIARVILSGNAWKQFMSLV